MNNGDRMLAQALAGLGAISRSTCPDSRPLSWYSIFYKRLQYCQQNINPCSSSISTFTENISNIDMTFKTSKAWSMEMMRSTTKQHDWHGKNILVLQKYVIHEKIFSFMNGSWRAMFWRVTRVLIGDYDRSCIQIFKWDGDGGNDWSCLWWNNVQNVWKVSTKRVTANEGRSRHFDNKWFI